MACSAAEALSPISRLPGNHQATQTGDDEGVATSVDNDNAASQIEDNVSLSRYSRVCHPAALLYRAYCWPFAMQVYCGSCCVCFALVKMPSSHCSIHPA